MRDIKPLYQPLKDKRPNGARLVLFGFISAYLLDEQGFNGLRSRSHYFDARLWATLRVRPYGSPLRLRAATQGSPYAAQPSTSSLAYGRRWPPIRLARWRTFSAQINLHHRDDENMRKSTNEISSSYPAIQMDAIHSTFRGPRL